MEKESQLKYKANVDISEGFVLLSEGGYVSKEALEAHQQWQQMAREVNEARSIFAKIFLVGKKTAMDFAHEEALREHEGRQRVENDFSALEKWIGESLEDIFMNSSHATALHDAIEQHHIDSIISEDAGGRFPAEILQRALTKIYRRKGQADARLVPWPIGRDTDPASAQRYATALYKNGILGRGALYVTEFISGGGTMRKSIDALSHAAQENNDAGKNTPTLYGFVTLGGTFPIGLDRIGLEEIAGRITESKDNLMKKEQRNAMDEITLKLLQIELRDLQVAIAKIPVAFSVKPPSKEHGDNVGFKKYSGVKRTIEGGAPVSKPRNLKEYNVYNSDAVEKRREQLIEKLSDAVVALYYANK